MAPCGCVVLSLHPLRLSLYIVTLSPHLLMLSLLFLRLSLHIVTLSPHLLMLSLLFLRLSLYIVTLSPHLLRLTHYFLTLSLHLLRLSLLKTVSQLHLLLVADAQVQSGCVKKMATCSQLPVCPGHESCLLLWQPCHQQPSKGLCWFDPSNKPTNSPSRTLLLLGMPCLRSRWIEGD